jgi:predicted Zn-dependent protease
LYEEARDADPQNLTIALRLGEVLRLQGEAEAALQQLASVLRSYPQHRAARVERALSLVDLGREAEARRDLQGLLEAKEDPRVRAVLEEISN